MPMVERFVETLDRYPLIAAMRAFIIGDDDPAAVDAINRQAFGAEEQSIGRTLRHLRNDLCLGVPFADRVGIGLDHICAQRRGW